MSTNAYVNLDARALHNLADAIHDGAVITRDSKIEALLRGIAQRVESMDAKLARHIDGDFTGGVSYAELRQRERSNILPTARHVTDEDGETLIAALAASGKTVHKAKPGESGLAPKAQTIKVDPAKSAPARRGWRLKDL